MSIYFIDMILLRGIVHSWNRRHTQHPKSALEMSLASARRTGVETLRADLGFRSLLVSYYRDVYLKSDDWKNLRLQKLIHSNFSCELCLEKSASNDVHHLKYKNIYDVSLSDLRVLCRKCHNFCHALLEKYPKMKSLKKEKLWRTVKNQFLMSKGLRVSTGCVRDVAESRLAKARKRLSKKGLINPDLMVFKFCIYRIESDIPIPDESYLSEYIRLTGIDPRIVK